MKNTNIMKEKLKIISEEKVKKELKNSLALIEILSIIYTMHIQRFLNKNVRLVNCIESRKIDTFNSEVTLSLSIDNESNRMKILIKYFNNRITWIKSKKDNIKYYGCTKWSQLCASTITLNHLKK